MYPDLFNIPFYQMFQYSLLKCVVCSVVNLYLAGWFLSTHKFKSFTNYLISKLMDRMNYFIYFTKLNNPILNLPTFSLKHMSRRVFIHCSNELFLLWQLNVLHNIYSFVMISNQQLLLTIWIKLLMQVFILSSLKHQLFTSNKLSNC